MPSALAKPHAHRSRLELLKVNEWLAHVPWLRTLPEGIRAPLLGVANGLKYAAGSTIYARGQPAQALYAGVCFACCVSLVLSVSSTCPSPFSHPSFVPWGWGSATSWWKGAWKPLPRRRRCCRCTPNPRARGWRRARCLAGARTTRSSIPITCCAFMPAGCVSSMGGCSCVCVW